MTNYVLKLGGKTIAHLKPTKAEDLQFKSEGFPTFTNEQTSTELKLRLNPMRLETTNIFYDLHYQYFYHKGREMLLFYLLNPEE